MAGSKDVKISYSVFESVEGSNPDSTPVIFLHGMLCSKEVWDKIPQAVADKTRRKVYAYDARDHGESDRTDNFTFDLSVEDLFNFMDRMNIPKAILVGHSMGGTTSMIAALTKPERVEMIFDIDMFVKRMPKDTADKLYEFATLFANTVRNISKDVPESEVLKAVVTRLYENIPEDSVFQIEKQSLMKTKFLFKRRPDGGYDVAYNEKAIIKFSEEAYLKDCIPDGQYKGPAYFIYGTESPIQIIKEKADIMKHFPEAKLIAFEGATHNVFVDFPDKLIQTLLDHF